jgi:hypothetical protein
MTDHSLRVRGGQAGGKHRQASAVTSTIIAMVAAGLGPLSPAPLVERHLGLCAPSLPKGPTKPVLSALPPAARTASIQENSLATQKAMKAS